jgi:hypothetical protein
MLKDDEGNQITLTASGPPPLFPVRCPCVRCPLLGVRGLSVA